MSNFARKFEETRMWQKAPKFRGQLMCNPLADDDGVKWVTRFIAHRLEGGMGSRMLPVDEVYSVYLLWCEFTHVTPVARFDFFYIAAQLQLLETWHADAPTGHTGDVVIAQWKWSRPEVIS